MGQTQQTQGQAQWLQQCPSQLLAAWPAVSDSTVNSWLAISKSSSGSADRSRPNCLTSFMGGLLRGRGARACYDYCIHPKRRRVEIQFGASVYIAGKADYDPGPRYPQAVDGTC